MMNNEKRVMQQEFTQCKDVIEQRLREYFSADNAVDEKLLEAMRYSLLAGGKRVRPITCLKFCEAAGGDASKALDAACAIEMLHTYSLIHDDLPSMDNSDMRRGKQTSHIKFGEFTAILAGDALQAAAFETLLKSDLPPRAVVDMARILAEAAGPDGICGGQHLDVLNVWAPLSVEELTAIHSLKTASLISASAKVGVVAAGGTQEQIKAAEDYALAVGLAFQVRDDVLDITEGTEHLGKPMGADMENNKTTFAMLLGIDKCEEIINRETDKAITALEGKFGDTRFLAWLANMLAERKK